MTENPLAILSTLPENKEPNIFSKKPRHVELRAKFERIWLVDPDCFNPSRNCMEKERVERTWQLMRDSLRLENKHAADIGCGGGFISRRLKDAGAKVEAIDIAENALKQFRKLGAEGIQLKQDVMPYTSLPDHHYDLIVCTELIAEIPQNDYRLFFAELSRLIKPDGYLVCSSAIDIRTVGGRQRLMELAQTEFEIVEEIFSYHRLYLLLKDTFNAPSRYIKAWEDSQTKEKDLLPLKGFDRGWFLLNSSPLLVWFWYGINPLLKPLRYLLKANRRLLLFLEKASRFLWDQEGISNTLFIAKRRPIQTSKPEERPQERLSKKEVWE